MSLKKYFSYPGEHFSKNLKKHKITLNRLLLQGLIVLDNRKPFLVYGEDLVSFLKKKSDGYKCHLSLSAFYRPEFLEHQI